MGRIYINRSWSRGLIFCEALNVLHIILQFYITNAFLSGQFLNLGPEIIEHGVDSSVDILDVVFPKVISISSLLQLQFINVMFTF